MSNYSVLFGISYSPCSNHFIVCDQNITKMELSPPTKIQKLDTDFSICFICQNGTADVDNPDTESYGKVLDFISERGQYGDKNFPEISRRISSITVEEIISKHATWHRSCYSETVHSRDKQRAKDKYEKKVVKWQCKKMTVMYRIPLGDHSPSHLRKMFVSSAMKVQLRRKSSGK